MPLGLTQSVPEGAGPLSLAGHRRGAVLHGGPWQAVQFTEKQVQPSQHLCTMAISFSNLKAGVYTCTSTIIICYYVGSAANNQM